MSLGRSVVIIGGGICGLSIGWYLAREGIATTVLDKGEAGRCASWAAAGMLAPQLEAEPSEEWLLPLLLESRKMWEAFARELEGASGIDVSYRTEGTLAVALDGDDASKLKFLYDFQRGMSLQVDWISGNEARKMEPHISRNVVAAISSPLDHQVDNRKVVLAVREAFIRAGGVLREHTEVKAIEIADDRVRGVKINDNILEAENVVLAAGAWSANIAGLPENVRPPVRPVKGQMLAVKMDPDNPILSHVVWGPDAYLVPRRDGRLLIGATVEDVGFDTSLTAGGIFHLLRGAWETLPGIYDLPIVEIWAGLRPVSRDDAPILGPTNVEGLIMATGHHRNGILLAPITAYAISQNIMKGDLPGIVKPFTLCRFAAKG